MGKLPKRFPCPKCSVICTTKQNLQRHMKLHGSYIRRVLCTICGESVANNSNLRIHYERRHSNQQVPEKLTFTSVKSQYPYRTNSELNDITTKHESNDENEFEEILGFDSNGQVVTSNGSSDSAAQADSIETAESESSIPDPIIAGEFLAGMHASLAKTVAADVPSFITTIGNMIMANSDQQVEQNEEGAINLIWKPTNDN